MVEADPLDRVHRHPLDGGGGGRLLAAGRLDAGLGDGAEVGDEAAGRAVRLAPRPGGRQLGQPREPEQALGHLGLGGEEALAAQADALDQPPHEDVGAALLHRRRGGVVELEEGLDPLPRLGLELGAVEGRLAGGDHVLLAPPRDRRQPRQVAGAQLDRRPRQRPRHRRRVAGVGERPQPGDRVAHLGPLEEGGGAGEVEGDAALLHRRRDRAALARPGRRRARRSPPGRRRRRAGARPRGRPPGIGRARWSSSRSGPPALGSGAPERLRRRWDEGPGTRRLPAPRSLPRLLQRVEVVRVVARRGRSGLRVELGLPPPARRPSGARSAGRSGGGRRGVRRRGSRGRGRRRRGRGCRRSARMRSWAVKSSANSSSRRAASRGGVVGGRRFSAVRARCSSLVGPTRSAFSASIRASSRASSPAGLPRISCRRSGSWSRRSSSIARRSAGPSTSKKGSRPAASACSRSRRSPIVSQLPIQSSSNGPCRSASARSRSRRAVARVEPIDEDLLGGGARSRRAAPAAAPAARSCRSRRRRGPAAGRRRGRSPAPVHPPPPPPSGCSSRIAQR